MAEPIPEKIGKYRIARPLGKGAMGMVYEGFDPVIERRVAIKTILAEYIEAADTPEALARFKREAQAGGRLQHPGIIAVFEYGEDGDMSYIVMEYADGQDLRRYFKDGRRFALIDVFEIMKQLLNALDYSHRQGVVHRDIKPANLMILPGPKVKVMDFGVARLEFSSLTQAGTVVGTPAYMAPEQLMGVPADGRADLWSSGVILYELLTGVSPFLADMPAAVMHKVFEGVPEAPSTLNPTLPQGFDGVVARALAKKPEDRFPSAKEFQIALLQALQGKAVAGVPMAPDPDRTLSPAEGKRAQATRAAMPLTATPPRPPLSVSPEFIAELERSLSRHIGPLAKVLIKQGRSEAADLDAFCSILAANIPNEAERANFLATMTALKVKQPAPVGEAAAMHASAPAAGKTRTAFTSEVLATAEKRLASYVGPLARVLIKEAAGKSGNLRELYMRLAAHIDADDERKAFLAALDR